jgi:hypothetical protein|tara:strand:- start:882 stop:1286 length:405 start_codon:yes stop_codon:yes gene_type:complete
MIKKEIDTYGCPVGFVKIGPFDYEIRWVDFKYYLTHMSSGQCEFDLKILWVVHDMGKWMMLDTLYHEINHAVEHTFGMKVDREEKDDEKQRAYRSEEQHVTVISTGTVGWRRDNSELRNWENSLYEQAFTKTDS